MKFAKNIHKSSLLALLAGIFLLAGVAPAQGPQWGKTKNGLTMGVSPTDPQRRAPGVRFVISFRNTGATDVLLNLGTTSADGKNQYPDKIVLNLINVDRPRNLVVRPPANPADVTPMIVQVAAGGTYSFPVRLADYWFPPNGDFSTRLADGHYSVEARFTGQASTQPPPASVIQGTSAPFWIGSIKSKRMHFYVGAPYYPGPYGYYPPRYGRPYPPPPPPPPSQQQQQSQSPYGDDDDQQQGPPQNGQPPSDQPQSPNTP